jgi:hypothetical protein
MEAIFGPHIGYMAAMTTDTRKIGLTGRQKLRPSLLCHPKNRLIRARDGEPGLNYLCAGLKKFYKHALPEVERIAAGIRKQQPVARK